MAQKRIKLSQNRKLLRADPISYTCDLTQYCVLYSQRAILTSFAARCLRSRFHLINWPLATYRLRIFKVWPCLCARGWRDVGRDVGRGQSCLIGLLVRLTFLYVTFKTIFFLWSQSFTSYCHSLAYTLSLAVLSFSGTAWFPLLFNTT